MKPPPAVILAEPIVSPKLIEEIAKEPTLEVNKPSSISASPGSWLTLTVKSDKLSQYVFDKDTDTVGENGVMHVSVSVKV